MPHRDPTRPPSSPCAPIHGAPLRPMREVPAQHCPHSLLHLGVAQTAAHIPTPHAAVDEKHGTYSVAYHIVVVAHEADEWRRCTGLGSGSIMALTPLEVIHHPTLMPSSETPPKQERGGKEGVAVSR